MKIWHYHETTRELLGEGEARTDPMEQGRWLIPAHATTVQAPERIEGKFRAFNGSEWEYRDLPKQNDEGQPAEVPKADA
jgi:hypothetical protein